MKILVINFLRLGDIVMMAPILNHIRKRHPGCEIHHLSFKEFAVAQTVLGSIKKWHFIHRKGLHQMTSCLDDSLFAPVDLLNDQLKVLDGEKFDALYNLSHTTFSSLFAGLIQAREKYGTYFEGDRLHFSSEGFRSMNEGSKSQKYHHLDGYRHAFGFGDEEVSWNLLRQEDSSFQNFYPLRQGRKLFLFQTLTSSEKKAWSRESWSRLFALIRRNEPLAELKMICAPNEKESLSSFAQNNQLELLPVSLKEALHWIERADFFITLDTSTKHLANAASCHVIELAFGSADFNKQSIYKPGAIILSPFSSCYPCAASGSCPLVKRECADGIRPQDVMNAIDYLEGRKIKSFSCLAQITTSQKLWSCQSIQPQLGESIETQSEVI